MLEHSLIMPSCFGHLLFYNLFYLLFYCFLSAFVNHTDLYIVNWNGVAYCKKNSLN